jgi:uncharacterized membrane protein
MANLDIIMPLQREGGLPVVRSIRPADLKEVLAKGFADFRAMPTHVIFLSLIYPVAGLFLMRAAFGYDFIPMLYPLAAGFALLGPIAAIGLYELSRRRELGMDTSWRHALDIVHSPSFPAIAGLGALLLAIFGVWIFCANAIYELNFGHYPVTSMWAFAESVLTTREGLNLIVYGNGLGFLFAVVAASISVVSFPLLLDRNVGFAAAVLTSVRAVLKNPVAMAVWGLIVAVALAVASLPFFVGLAVMIPILGHSTWHLYRKVVEPDLGARPEFHPRPKGVRYAADFPASLFVPSKREKQE